ncbi:MAG TPA: glycosyltransferase [Pseudobacteroides sp.]|uniref:glycosyltransferase n=1 Tax=Pseudobacteroides sp. TaxID=1968840 RepID=UPI002F948EE9
MKALFLFSEGFDTPNPSIHLMNALIEDTLKSGIEVHMIASRITGKNSDVPDNLKKYEKLSYGIVPRKKIPKNAFAKRYLEGIGYAFACVKPIKKSKDHDVIFVQSSPTALYVILAAKLFGKNKPIVYNIQDMFPGSSIHSGIMKNKLMQVIFYKLQKIAYKVVSSIVVISEDMKQRVIEQGVPDKKIVTIVNWYDDSSVREVSWEENRFVKKYNLTKDKFYIQYAGTMGYVFDYKMVLNVAKLFLKEYKNIEFQMIGQGSQKFDFIKEMDEMGLYNIAFYPLQPQNMVSDVYSACSVCLIPLKKGIIGNSVPSKAGLLMACNRAIVNCVDKDSSYFRMFNENHIGVAVSNDDPKAVAQAILNLYKNEEKRGMLAKNGQKFGEMYYARSSNTIKYIELFKKIVQESGKNRMKVLIIGFGKISYMPYLNFYLDRLRETKCETHLLYWDRDGKPDCPVPEDVTSYKYEFFMEDFIPKWRKIRAFLGYRKKANKIIKSGDFDFVITLHTLPGVLLYNILRKGFKNRFILDYRDCTFEHIGFFKKIVHGLVKRSSLTFVSSDAFRKFLPETSKIYTSHNLLIDSLKYRDEFRTNKRSNYPIRIRFWGLIRHEEINMVLIDRFANDERFELHYHGREQKVGLMLRGYCEMNNIKNVYFHGEYKPEDRYQFAKETDLLHNVYENDTTMTNAISNKYYDGMLFYIPQLCNEGSFMGEKVHENNMGLTLDPNSEDYAQSVYLYYISIDWNAFIDRCDKVLCKILNQYDEGIKKFEGLFSDKNCNNEV